MPPALSAPTRAMVSRGLFFVFAAVFALGGTAARAILIDADDPRLRYLGRYHWQNPKEPQFGLAGTQILARFTGSSVAVRLRDNVGGFTGGNNAYYAVVNEDFSQRVLIRPTSNLAVTWPVASGLGPGPHTLRVMRIGSIYSASSTFLGLELAPGGQLLDPPAPLPRRIEFWGDSVTEGSFQESPTWIDAIDTNHWIAYGTKTARRLGADYVSYSRSGLGLWAGYQLPAVLTSTYSARYRGDLPPWDFPRHLAPHVLVINIGQNDYWTNTGAANAFIRERYGQILRLARMTYPEATVVLAVGSMSLGSTTDAEALRWQAQIAGAVADAQAAGDSRVHYLRLPRMEPTATDPDNSRHPQDADTEVMAAQLEAFLGTLPASIWSDPPAPARFEAEALPAAPGATAPVPTVSLDPGSHGGRHLDFAATAVGQGGGVVVPVSAPGWHHVQVWMRRLPALGRVLVSAGGQPLGPEIDLYRPSTNSLLQAWVRAEGTVWLEGPEAVVGVEVRGRNNSSNGHRFGFTLDSIWLRPVGPPPVVQWQAPVAATQPAGATVTLSAAASPGLPAGANVARVEFFVQGGAFLEPTLVAAPRSASAGGSWDFAWPPLVPAATPYTFQARAVAADGAVTVSPPVTVTLTNTPPVVNLTSPVDGARYERGATIPLTVSTSDPDGTVVDIRYERGTTRITNRTVAPFSANWTGVGSGVYVLRAVATDNLTAQAISATRTITVAPPAPTGLVATPGAGRVDFTWTPISGSGVTYRLYRQPLGGGTPLLVATTTSNLGAASDSTGLPGERYAYTVTAIESGAEGVAGGRVEAASWTSFQAWRAQRFSDPEGLGAGGNVVNVDGDPWNNLWEYALDLDPGLPDGPGAVVFETVAGRLQVRFHAGVRPDLRWAVEAGASPAGPWTQIWSRPGSDLVAGWNAVADTESPSPAAPRALRLTVEELPRP